MRLFLFLFLLQVHIFCLSFISVCIHNHMAQYAIQFNEQGYPAFWISSSLSLCRKRWCQLDLSNMKQCHEGKGLSMFASQFTQGWAVERVYHLGAYAPDLIMILCKIEEEKRTDFHTKASLELWEALKHFSEEDELKPWEMRRIKTATLDLY